MCLPACFFKHFSNVIWIHFLCIIYGFFQAKVSRVNVVLVHGLFGFSVWDKGGVFLWAFEEYACLFPTNFSCFFC